MGLDQAADNLDHFLDGTGQGKVFTREEARERRFIRDAEAENQDRFVERFFNDEEGKAYDRITDVDFKYHEQLKGMKDGETVQLVPDGLPNPNDPTDYWKVQESTADALAKGEVDEALAYGTNDFESLVQNGFTATRDGEIITITSTITHEWTDRYNFDKDSFPDTAMNALRDTGRAAEYDSSLKWNQELTLEVKIVDGELVPGDPVWRDID